MTTAVRTPPNHDTTTCYTEYRCRRPECVARYNTLNQQRLRARRAGTYDRFVDAEPVRHHILNLQRAGMAADAIATVAGVPTQTVLEFVRVRPSKGRGRRRRTTPATAAKILAVTPADQATGRIDATGTRRRMQALVAIGWPVRHIATHAGLHPTTTRIPDAGGRVYVATAKAVAATYDRLRHRRPTAHGVTAAHMQRAKNLGSRNGWPPPTYWDQHPGEIDNPDYMPMTPRQVIAEEARWFMAMDGLSVEQVAKRLRRSATYVRECLQQHPESDEAAR